MKCFNCGKTPYEHGITLLRQNPKGEVGIWACETCNRKPVEKELSNLVAVIQSGQIPPNKFKLN